MTLDIQRVAVVGAGTMGSGIAQTCAAAGLEAVLHDVDPDGLEAGRDRIDGSLRRRVDGGKMAPDEADAVRDRLETTTDLSGAVPGADLVVEAVFEDLDVKREVFDDVDDLADEEAILATNTSSLSVTELAEATDRPERFAGLHFFYPAHRNWLLEVVGGDRTDPDLVDGLVTWGRRIGKVPIETADSYGFAVNRFFIPWVNEAVRLVDEGVADKPTVEAAAKEAFSVPMGPFELMNVTGPAISLHACRTLHDAFGPFHEPAKGLVHQVEEAQEDWTVEGEPDPDRFGAVKERLRGVAFGVAARLVDEGVATPRDTDKGATVGLRWKQGPFALMNDLGLDASLAAVEALHRDWGDDFPVPDNLETRAETNTPWTLPKVRLEHRGAVAGIVVDDPPLNALGPDTVEDLADAVDDLDRMDDVRAAVLAGEGPMAFAAGADIAHMKDLGPEDVRRYTEAGQEALRAIEQLDVPTVAAVDGTALGGGLELALAADIVLAESDAELGLPETSLGIIPGFGGTQRLPREVGPQEAKRLVYTADRVTGEEAAEIGLALDHHEGGDLHDAAWTLAQRVADNAPVAVRQAKEAVDRGLQADLDTGLALEREAAATTFATDDQEEGMAAFLEDRAPEFRGE
jgi:enoyl-CoA hydratase/3-hydroxyacyl-CoA dehydrogenase